MVTGWAGPENFQALGIFLQAVRMAFPNMPPPPAPPPVFSLADPDSFKVQMEAAGFDEVEVSFVSRELEVDDFVLVEMNMIIKIMRIKMLFDRVGPQGKGKVRDTLAGIIEKRFGSGPIHLTNVATVGSGHVSLAEPPDTNARF